MTSAPDIAPPFTRIGIAGLGLIGGSIALAARLAWPRVRLAGFDRDPAVAGSAVARGVVHEVAPDVAALADADLVIVAVPVPSAPEVLAAIGEADVIVTDVGSTKRSVMAAAAAARLRRFVGGHPMGGSERGGLDAARADLFLRRPWLLVGSGTGAADCRTIERFVAGLGAIPRWTDADAHDRAMAYISHLPQLISVALMNAACDGLGAPALATAGRAFTEMTRLAMSPPDLWSDILASNADFLAEAIADLTAHLPGAAQLTDPAWVREAFARAASARVSNLGDTSRGHG